MMRMQETKASGEEEEDIKKNNKSDREWVDDCDDAVML